MQRFFPKFFSYTCAFTACGIMSMTTGCASGGYHLTRSYAGWVNQQHIILRIIIYIFTTIVFAVTLIVDFVWFNTMDFWEGRLSSGVYDFEKDGKTFHVNHEIVPGNLKRSTIMIRNAEGKLLQEVVLKETEDKFVELYVDGKLTKKERGFTSPPLS